MAVALSQITEVISVLSRYVSKDVLEMLIDDLRKTAAYRSNSSFRETVKRLAKAESSREGGR